jgi:hypothetical protein
MLAIIAAGISTSMSTTILAMNVIRLARLATASTRPTVSHAHAAGTSG